MELRRMFRRPKPVEPADRVVDITDRVVDVTDQAARSPGPRQQWSRPPPESAMAAVAVVAYEGPAWAPVSWRVETDSPPATRRAKRRFPAARVARDDAMEVHTERDQAMAVHPAKQHTAPAQPEQEDVLTVAAREIDRMAEEIRTNPSEDAELALLQEHARRLEALTRANPYLLKKK